MKKLVVLAIAAIALPAVAVFAGEPVVSSKAVIAPPPTPPEFFRPNEFDLGAFGTYATGVGSGENAGKLHAWGGGIDLTYWFPWKYAGVRFQGTGASIQGGGGERTQEVVVPGFAPVSVTGGGGSVAAGVLTSDVLLRLPLDEFWPGVHLAPYFFAGFGGILLGSGGEGHSVDQTFTVTNSAGVTREGHSQVVASARSDRTLAMIACLATSAEVSSIALRPTSGFLAKPVTTLSMGLRITLSRSISASDTRSKRNKEGKISAELEICPA